MWRSCSRVSQRASVRVEILLGFAGGCWILSSDQHRLYQKRQTSLLVLSKRKKLLSSHSRYTTDYNIVFETKTNVKYCNFNYFFCPVPRAKKRQTHGWLNSECFQPVKRRKRQILTCSSILRIQFIFKERTELAKNSAHFQEFPNGIKVIYINSIFPFVFESWYVVGYCSNHIIRLLIMLLISVEWKLFILW